MNLNAPFVLQLRTLYDTYCAVDSSSSEPFNRSVDADPRAIKSLEVFFRGVLVGFPPAIELPAFLTNQTLHGCKYVSSVLNFLSKRSDGNIRPVFDQMVSSTVEHNLKKLNDVGISPEQLAIVTQFPFDPDNPEQSNRFQTMVSKLVTDLRNSTSPYDATIGVTLFSLIGALLVLHKAMTINLELPENATLKLRVITTIQGWFAMLNLPPDSTPEQAIMSLPPEQREIAQMSSTQFDRKKFDTVVKQFQQS